MTPKELLYLEDCLGIEQQLQTKCYDFASKVQDQNLRNFLTQLADTHQQRYNTMINHLN